MRGQGFDVGAISCEDDASGFGDCNDERVDRRAGFRASTQLGAKRDLEKLGGREVALLELIMQVIGWVHLDAWHTSFWPSM